MVISVTESSQSLLFVISQWYQQQGVWSACQKTKLKNIGMYAYVLCKYCMFSYPSLTVHITQLCVQLYRNCSSVQLYSSVQHYLPSSRKAPRQLTGSEDRRYRYSDIAGMKYSATSETWVEWISKAWSKLFPLFLCFAGLFWHFPEWSQLYPQNLMKHGK